MGQGIGDLDSGLTIKDHENNKCEVVCNNCLGAGELSIVNNIKPGAEQKDPGNAIKSSLKQQKNSV